jgi:hypothetical protein
VIFSHSLIPLRFLKCTEVATPSSSKNGSPKFYVQK